MRSLVMKLLNLQSFFNGCLHPTHNSSSSSTPNYLYHAKQQNPKLKKPKKPKSVVKVIKYDGMVIIYRRKIRASELMLQFPKHLLCHSNSFFIGQKIQPLSPKKKLRRRHTYFLLPIHFFQSVLTFVTVASSFASLNNRLPPSTTANTKPATNTKPTVLGSCQAFNITKSPSGSLQVRVSEEFISKLIQQGKIEEEELYSNEIICSTPLLQKEYTQLVSFRQWKPKLETIKESKRKRLFGIRRKKKVQSKVTQQKPHKPKNEHKQKTKKIKVKAKK